MRISDWSSDVCSSDLRVKVTHVDVLVRQTVGRVEVVGVGAEGDMAPVRRDRDVSGGNRDSSRDRKSVVSGKSVSVRVDLGGRRLIKKTNTDTNTNTPIITNIYLTRTTIKYKHD